MKHSIPVRLASYGFRLGLFFVAITTSLGLVFGTPDTLKSALQDSGAYPAASDAIAKQAGTMVNPNSNQLLDSADLSNAAKESFTPQVIQTNAENAIDSTYGWLEGTTEKPDIKLDLKPYIDQFTGTLGNQAVQQAQGLPPCTLEQLRAMDPSNIDVFNLQCQPPGIDLNTAKDQAIAKAMASNDFLQDPVLTVDDLPKDAEGNTVFDNTAGIAGAYQWATRGPWIFGGLAILCATLIMWLLRSEWREGVRKLARSLLGVGIVLVVTAGLVRLFFSFITQPDKLGSKLTEGNFQDVILTFVSTLEKAYNNKVLIFGIVYVAVAAAALITLRFLRPQALEAVTASPQLSTASNNADSAPSIESEPPVSKDSTADTTQLSPPSPPQSSDNK